VQKREEKREEGEREPKGKGNTDYTSKFRTGSLYLNNHTKQIFLKNETDAGGTGTESGGKKTVETLLVTRDNPPPPILTSLTTAFSLNVMYLRILTMISAGSSTRET
jgi:hypothetical protein